jgi:hypothetical protein
MRSFPESRDRAPLTGVNAVLNNRSRRVGRLLSLAAALNCAAGVLRCLRLHAFWPVYAAVQPARRLGPPAVAYRSAPRPRAHLHVVRLPRRAGSYGRSGVVHTTFAETSIDDNERLRAPGVQPHHRRSPASRAPGRTPKSPHRTRAERGRQIRIASPEAKSFPP